MAKPRALQNAERVTIYSVYEVRDAQGRLLHSAGAPITVHAIDARELLRGKRYVGTLREAERILSSAVAEQAIKAPPAPLKRSPSGPDFGNGAEPKAPPAPQNGSPGSDSDNALPGTFGASAPAFNLSEVPGLGKEIVAKLEQAGYSDLDKLRKASIDELTEVPGIGTKYAQALLMHIQEKYPAGDLVADEDNE